MVAVVASQVFAMTSYPSVPTWGPRVEIMSPHGFSISVCESVETIKAALGFELTPQEQARVDQRHFESYPPQNKLISDNWRDHVNAVTLDCDREESTNGPPVPSPPQPQG